LLFYLVPLLVFCARKMAAPSMSHSFKGKRILVTGGGRGIGNEIVKKFYNDGAQLFVIDRDPKLLETVKKEMPKVTTVCVDLLDWEATKKAVTDMAPLDHLVNNAGIVGDTPFLEVTQDTFDKVMGVNVRAIVNVSQAFAKGVINNKREKEGATIVNISSLGDRTAFWGASCYGASKGAVTMLTKSMALELGEHGIRVNSVNPTFVVTDLILALDPKVIERSTEVMQRTIIKDKQLSTADIANSVLFLSSPLSQMITGESLIIDSGTNAI